MTRHIRSIAMTFVVAVFTFTSAAVAQSFTGNWPATVTHSQRSNGTDCISLTDNGSFGAPHSGPASMVSNGNPVSGSFTVVDGIMTISFSYPSGEGDCCSYQVFTAQASKGQIGHGVYNFFGITDPWSTGVRQKRQLHQLANEGTRPGRPSFAVFRVGAPAFGVRHSNVILSED